MRKSLMIFLVAVAATILLVPASAAPQSGVTRLVPKGNGWGTSVSVGGAFVSGPSAFSAFGCGDNGDSNKLASVAARGVRTGTVKTSSRALTIDGDPGARSTTVVKNLNLLNGLITAEAAKAVSTTSGNGSQFRSTGAGSAFLNLKIGGRSVNATAKQRVDLPGVGYVLLNRSVGWNGGSQHQTRMIEVHVTQNAPRLGLSSGRTIVVAHAHSGLDRVGGILGGTAFGSQASAASGSTLAAGTGPSARLFLPCHGTNDEVRRNEVATVRVPWLFTLGNVVSTARGNTTAQIATGRMTNTVEQASVVGGLVRARGVRAVASGSAESGRRVFSSGGSFVALSVRGSPGINANVAPNTRRQIPGLGTLWLHRVIRGETSREVRMVELIVTEPNSRALPVGARVQVGVARVSIR